MNLKYKTLSNLSSCIKTIFLVIFNQFQKCIRQKLNNMSKKCLINGICKNIEKSNKE